MIEKLSLHKNSPLNVKLLIKIILCKKRASKEVLNFSKREVLKSVEQSQKKECKKRNHKISYESLSSVVYDSFILELWY